MGKPVYVVQVHKRKEALYQIDSERLSEFITENVELLKQANGEKIIDLHSLTPDAWRLSVRKYPDMESAIKGRLIWDARNERYLATTTYMGVAGDDWRDCARRRSLSG